MDLIRYIQAQHKADSARLKNGRHKPSSGHHHRSSKRRHRSRDDENEQDSSDGPTRQPNNLVTLPRIPPSQAIIMKQCRLMGPSRKPQSHRVPRRRKTEGQSQANVLSHTKSEKQTENKEHRNSKKEKEDTSSSNKKNRDGRKKVPSTCEKSPETSVVLRTPTDESHASGPDASAVGHHRRHRSDQGRKSHGGESRDYSHVTLDSSMLRSCPGPLQGLPPRDHTMVSGGGHWQMTEQTPRKQNRKHSQATLKLMATCNSQEEGGQAEMKSLELQKSSWDMSQRAPLGEGIQESVKPLQIDNAPKSEEQRMLLEMGSDSPIVVKPRRTLLLPAPESSTDHQAQSQPRPKRQTRPCWYNTCDEESFRLSPDRSHLGKFHMDVLDRE